MRAYDGQLATAFCRTCGALAELRRWVDDEGDEAGWEQQPHAAPCGLPCRASHFGKGHGRNWCSSCGALTARRRRHIRRSYRRRIERQRRAAA